MRFQLKFFHTLQFVLGTFTIFALPATGSAIVITTAADTFISADNQNSNYGSNTNLNVLEGGAGFSKDRYTFIRFDLSPYAGGTVSGASLTLIPQDLPAGGSSGFELYGIPDFGISENFDENALTFANSGYSYTSSAGSMNTSVLSFLGSLTVPATSEGIQFEFGSSMLDAFLSADTNNIASFILINPFGDTTEGGFFNKFDSKEHVSGGSFLTVVPEPSALTLTATGIVAAVCFTRRRR